MCLYEVAVDSYLDNIVNELTDGMELQTESKTLSF
jgi:hypothetical protein